MGWTRPEWADWHEDPREQELREREDYCEQCGKVRTETCVACGDEDGLHAA